jgi:hypothetical protein
MLSSTLVNEDFAGACRRQMLKSGLLMAFGASLPVAGTAAPQGASSGVPTAPAPSRARSHSGSLSKGLVGFMLAHEQFPAPELNAWELRQKTLGSICWLRVIISSPGKRTSATPDRLG